MMNPSTPYRGLLDSFSLLSKTTIDKQNFQAFKQKKYKQIDQARQRSQSQSKHPCQSYSQHQHHQIKQLQQSLNNPKKKPILKPTSLNLRNINMNVIGNIQQGPPTFDSQYEFRNLLVSDNQSNVEDREMNQMKKEFDFKIKQQKQKYQLQIIRLNNIIETIRSQQYHKQLQQQKQSKFIESQTRSQTSSNYNQSHVEYCHLCSNGEVIARMNKMMKGIEEAHQGCVSKENENSKRIMQLEMMGEEYKENMGNLVKEKNVLMRKVNGYESQIRVLREQLKEEKDKLIERERQRERERQFRKTTQHLPSQYQSHNLSISSTLANQRQKQKQKTNIRSLQSFSSSTTHQRSSLHQHPKIRQSSTHFQPSLSKRSSSSAIIDQPIKPKRNTILDQYQHELSAAQIIDRVKTNSMLGSSINPRTRILQDKKFGGMV